jgi:hypothetical protein
MFPGSQKLNETEMMFTPTQNRLTGKESAAARSRQRVFDLCHGLREVQWPENLPCPLRCCRKTRGRHVAFLGLAH